MKMLFNRSMLGAILPAMIATASLALFPAGTEAAPLAYEGFEYSSPTLAGQTGGTGWSGTWKSNATLTTDSTAIVQPTSLMAPPGYSYEPAGGSVTGGNDVGLLAYRALETPINLDSDEDYYVSILTRRTRTPRAMTVALQAGTSTVAMFGHSTGGTAFVGGIGGTVSGSDPVIGVGSTHLFVFKIDAASGAGQDQIFLETYRSDPTPHTVGPEPETYELVGNPAAHNGVITQFSVAAGGTATLEIDEIRIGTTFADVAFVPEPAVALPAALLGVLACRRRRARRDHEGTTAPGQV